MRILVIGGGVAGLTAAGRLRTAGHDLVVVDKGRVPGGRVSTRRVTGGAGATGLLQFDHGAQYVTAREDTFAEEVARWAAAGIVKPWRGRLASFDSEGREAVEDTVTRWVGVPSMSAIGRHLAEGLDVRTSTRVNTLTRDDRSGAWHATVATGDIVSPFDAVVVATPAPQAVDLLGDAPRLAAEAGAVHMHPCWAVLVAFEAPVPVRFDGAFVLHSPLGWVARDGSKPKRARVESWVLHASAAWSAAHLTDQPDTVGPFLLNAFADLVPARLPLPVHLSVHRWRYASADPPIAKGMLVDHPLRIAVCGDWCVGNRVESASLSGCAAADALLLSAG
jgi:renalase